MIFKTRICCRSNNNIKKKRNMKASNNINKKGRKSAAAKLRSRIMKAEKTYPCDDCDRVFLRKATFQLHEKVCKIRLSTDNNNVINFRNTITTTNATNNATTTTTATTTVTPSIINDEIKVRNDQLSTSNFDKKKKDKSQENVKDNQETVNNKKMEQKTEYICYSCGLVCKDLLSYKAHCKTHTTRVSQTVIKKYSEMYSSPPKECPICNREQKGSKQAWLRHLDTHNSDVPLHYCSICKKGFRRSDHKNKHEKRHLIAKTTDGDDEED